MLAHLSELLTWVSVSSTEISWSVLESKVSVVLLKGFSSGRADLRTRRVYEEL